MLQALHTLHLHGATYLPTFHITRLFWGVTRNVAKVECDSTFETVTRNVARKVTPCGRAFTLHYVILRVLHCYCIIHYITLHHIKLQICFLFSRHGCCCSNIPSIHIYASCTIIVILRTVYHVLSITDLQFLVA